MTGSSERTDDQLIEDIYNLDAILLGEGAATCQVCCSSLREGDGVVVYVFRPAGEVMFQAGYVLCGGEDHERPEEFTLGVRELLVEGRIGVCSDEVTESSWQVLLDAVVVAVSAAATKSVRLVRDGGSSTKGGSGVEGSETSEMQTTLSLEEPERCTDRPDGGVFWGGER